ncbi:hypothetical protein, partial [Paenibacillus cymbidii]|uniref:hypothetical protein n=1 Tax=Paenibacillus cymbidii TaxID=1639034 RepID=UPI001A9A6EA1
RSKKITSRAFAWATAAHNLLHQTNDPHRPDGRTYYTNYLTAPTNEEIASEITGYFAKKVDFEAVWSE